MTDDWPGRFTASGDPAAEPVIAGHVRQIRERILALGPRYISCIVLTGGFGRGEGGVTTDGLGAPRPVNDYDLLVVARGNSLPAFLRLRQRLKDLAPALSRACGLRVDIACKTPRMLGRMPHTVEACEMALAHHLIWGDAAPLEAIRWREPAMLPKREASRYLFNRGAALLWARQMVQQAGQFDEDRWRFVLIAIQKARLSWGDALLLLHGRYVPRYSQRMGRLTEPALPPVLDFVPEAYREALQFKLFPDFGALRSADLSDWLDDTIERHQVVWEWMESGEDMSDLQGIGLWLERFDSDEPLLREADSTGRPVGERLSNLSLNLWRVRPRTTRLLFHHPEERLVRVLPLLLFAGEDATLPWPAMARLLGEALHGVDGGIRERLSDQLVRIWHPGPPY